MSAPKRQRPSLTPNVESIVKDPARTAEAPAAPTVTEPQPSTEAPAPAQPTEPAAVDTPAAPARRKRAPRKPKDAPAATAGETAKAHVAKAKPQAEVRVPDPGTKGPEDIMSASNVHIPVILDAPVKTACRERGISHGELIIIAIEATYERLDDLVNPGTRAGGSLFAARRGRAGRSSDGPLTPLNFRMSKADFTVLDNLTEEFGASSRGHLITAALKAYLDVSA